MFSIDNKNKIYLTKGDNAEFEVKISYADGTPYILQEGDVVVFTMKVSPNAETTIRKTTTTGTIIFVPTDTNTLASGLYVYDVQLSTGNGRIYTVIPTSFFQLCSEVSV